MTRWGGGGQDVVGWGTRRGEKGDNKSWWREGQNKVGRLDKTCWGRETRHGLGTRCDGEGDKKRWEGGQASGFLKGDSGHVSMHIVPMILFIHGVSEKKML